MNSKPSLRSLEDLRSAAERELATREARRNVKFIDWAAEHGRTETGARIEFENRPYLRALYEDMHPYIVLEKSAQGGGSLWVALRCMWLADCHGRTSIYYMPTFSDVKSFSGGRVSEMIRNSPHISERVGDGIENVSTRKMGAGFLYFLGMKSNTMVKSIPADALTFDELDEADPIQKTKALERMAASDLKWVVELSNPTLPNKGVDIQFKLSDQRYWNVTCYSCGRVGILEEDWPDNLDRERFILVCPECKEPLDNKNGEWVAKSPEVTDRRGYHMSQLMQPNIDLKQFWKDYTSTDANIVAECMRLKLGRPYVAGSQRLSLDEVMACREDYAEPTSGRQCSMGVDVGRVLHLQISMPNRETGRRRVLRIGTVSKFSDLDILMRAFDVRRCVIDAQPELHEVQAFQDRFPGRVYRCYYPETKDPEKWNKVERSVSVNRTAAIDACRALFSAAAPGIELPGKSPNIDEYAKHANALVRQEIENPKTHEIRVDYERTGDDHWFHAALYDMLAFTSLSGTSFRDLAQVNANFSTESGPGHGIALGLDVFDTSTHPGMPGSPPPPTNRRSGFSGAPTSGADLGEFLRSF